MREFLSILHYIYFKYPKSMEWVGLKGNLKSNIKVSSTEYCVQFWAGLCLEKGDKAGEWS